MYFTRVYMQRTVGDAGLRRRVRPGAQFPCIFRRFIGRRVRPGAQFLCILQGFSRPGAHFLRILRGFISEARGRRTCYGPGFRVLFIGDEPPGRRMRPGRGHSSSELSLRSSSVLERVWGRLARTLGRRHGLRMEATPVACSLGFRV